MKFYVGASVEVVCNFDLKVCANFSTNPLERCSATVPLNTFILSESKIFLKLSQENTIQPELIMWFRVIYYNR